MVVYWVPPSKRYAYIQGHTNPTLSHGYLYRQGTDT
jgi:hypothetical protein